MDRQICVVGAGRWGRNHIKTLAGLGSLGGVVEANEETFGKIREVYPDTQTFPCLEDSLDAGFDGFTASSHLGCRYTSLRCEPEEVNLESGTVSSELSTGDRKRVALTIIALSLITILSGSGRAKVPSRLWS